MQDSIVTYQDWPHGTKERNHPDTYVVAVDDNESLVLLDEDGGTVAIYPRGQWVSYRSEDTKTSVEASAKEMD